MHGYLYEAANPIGLIGVIVILVAYYYLSVGKWVADSMVYQICNFAGAWMILYSLLFYWNLSSVIIEVAWIVISVLGMYRLVKTAKK